MKTLHLISRILIGVTFMFSGFVKGIDPLGTAYRLEDYFMVWGTDWMIPAAVTLSILLSTMEFVLGFVVLINLKPKVNSWILLSVMAYFTVLTFYDAIANPVPDCGCFGDAIKLTNVQTFIKNVILSVPTIFLFVNRKKVADKYSDIAAYGTASVVTFLFIVFCVYNLWYLPVIDFMDWKKGNKMYSEKTLPVKYYVTYKNKTTGEEKEYLSPNYPYNDSVWMSEWEFVNQRVDDPNINPGADLQIVDLDGNDVTETVIQNPSYNFILVCWDINKAQKSSMKEMSDFASRVEADGFSFVALTSSLREEIGSVADSLGLMYDFYQADDVTLKTMVRSNPGLIMMKDGVVIDKWAHRELPLYDQIKEDLMLVP